MAFKLRGVLAIAAGFLIHLTLGTFFTFGNMTTYMTSYMRHHVDGSVDYSKSIWINALTFAGQGALMVLGGILEKKIGVRLSCLLGCFLFSASTVVTYFAVQTSFVLTALLYGLTSGLGLGIAYVVPLVNGMRWYPERKGLVNGIITGGFGLGALVFNQVQTAYLNPNNTSPAIDGYFDEGEVLDRVPSSFLLLGGVYALLELIGIVLLHPTTPSRNRRIIEIPNSNSKEESDVRHDAVFIVDESKKPAKNPADGIGIRAMVRKREFYILWFTFALNVQSVLYMNTMYKAYGQTFIQDDQFLSIVGSGASLFNALGRIIWGRLQDKFGYKKCMMTISCSLTILLLTFITTPYGGKVTFSIWVLGIFFSFAGLACLMPSATAQVFGPKNVGANFGVIFTGPSVSSIAGAQLVGLMQHSLGWFGSFCFVASFSAVAFCITLLFPSDPSIVLKKHFEPLKQTHLDHITEPLSQGEDQRNNKELDMNIMITPTTKTGNETKMNLS